MSPSIDMIGPDIYADDSPFYRETMRAYHRPDNPLWIPETGRSDSFGKFFFYALGDGAIGFSPFGVDHSGWNIFGDEPWKAHANNFALIGPMSREIAQLEFDGKLKTAVEEPGQTAVEVDFGAWHATVAFGFPQPDGRRAPGTKDAHGAALVAQLGPDEFLVTGFDASISFHLPGKLPWMRSQIISAEKGIYERRSGYGMEMRPIGAFASMKSPRWCGCVWDASRRLRKNSHGVPVLKAHVLKGRGFEPRRKRSGISGL